MTNEQQLPIDLQRIEASIKSHPRVRERVREVLFFEKVESTNKTALQMGAAGLPSGVVILSDEQTQGVGRLNRTWISPKGVNLYLSLLLRPYQPIREFPLFSLATALAAVQAIRAVTKLEAVVKWPNDILLNDKKIAGILLEAGNKAGESPYLVIGIGVNVNWDEADIPKDIADQTTSLKTAVGHVIDRNDLVNELLIALSEQWTLLDKWPSDLLITNLSEVCVTLGKRVRVTTADKTIEGIASGISKEGGLILQLADNSQRTIYAGDVTKVNPALPAIPRRNWSS